MSDKGSPEPLPAPLLAPGSTAVAEREDRPVLAAVSEEAPVGAETEGPPAPAATRGADHAQDSAEAQEDSRYAIGAGEQESYILCHDAPNLRLYVERGLAVTKSGRKRYPRQTIFLDGAYADAPFLDNQQRQYSLDHHAGCIRPFTLATCEQAAVMLLQGVPLDEGDWRIYINEPDLDAVLATWLLFNRAELLADDNKLLREVMPLVRVEGVIDTHGFDMALLSALPTARYQAEKERIDALRGAEARLRRDGQWDTVDFRRYAAELLRQLDNLLVPAEYWQSRIQVQEVAELALEERKLAVLCHSQGGIYEAEAQLKRRFGKQLGVIVLDQGEDKFTLRQVDPFLPRSLDDAFKLLNEGDPRVQDPATAGEENSWGGSAEIGGSPRGSGSGLQGRQVLEHVRCAYTRRRRWWRRVFRRKRG